MSTDESNQQSNLPMFGSKKTKTKRTPKGGANYYPMVKALAQVTGMDLKANSGRLFKEAQRLAACEDATPEVIEQHYGPCSWWYREDWRGKRGERPNLGTIRETWGQWMRSVVRVEAPTGLRSDWLRTAIDATEARYRSKHEGE